MNEEIIYQFSKNTKETVICTLKMWNDKPYFDIRVYYTDDKQTLKPTTKGLCLSANHITELKHILDKLEIVLKSSEIRTESIL